MQDPVTFIEPIELFNLLNQVYLGVPCLVREHGIVLFDTRKPKEYAESHIITAKHVQYSEADGYLLPKNIDYTAVEHIVVIDNRTSSLKDLMSTGVACAKYLYNKLGSKYSVKVVRGGYEHFSALYPFLRSSKIMFTQREKYLIKMYPIEMVAQFLYNGTFDQAADPLVAKHLKIKAHINTTTKTDPRFNVDEMASGQEGKMVPHLLNIPLDDDIKSDAYPHFTTVCTFIDNHNKKDGKAVLIYSDLGVSRSAVFVLAYLMHALKIPLKEALAYTLKYHQSYCPNRAFVDSLMKWEEDVLKVKVTKADDLGYLSYQ